MTLMKKLRVPGGLFIATVVVPVFAAILYFGFLASDVYVSVSKFVVRSPDKPAASGLGVLLQTAGFNNASEEVNAAQSYANSRDALRAINRRAAFQVAYTRPHVSVIDRFNPLGYNGSFEDLFKYFQNKVELQNDATTSISTLTVRAYTPQDAYKFNAQLLQLSEATVNRLNLRGRQDLVGYAQTEVGNAKRNSQSAALALAAYRNRTGILDPEQQAQVQMQMVSKLQDALIAARTELTQLQRYAPDNPRIPVVRTQIASIQEELNVELGKVTGNRGSLAAAAVRFERLSLESQFADRQLAAALTSLEEARNDARRKEAYVERIVQPNLPDDAIEPRRIRGIFATLALALLAYGILRMLLSGVREHVL